MKLVEIDESTKVESVRTWKRMKKNVSNAPWWHVPPDKMPAHAIEARSTGGGIVKPGVRVYLIAGHNREVFPDNAKPFKLYEYVGLVEGTGWQPLIQLGRDVEMT